MNDDTFVHSFCLALTTNLLACYVEHKTCVDLKLQENWWRKFWQLITLILAHKNLQYLANKTSADC